MRIDRHASPVRGGAWRIDREPTVTLQVTFECDEEFARAFTDFCRGRGVNMPGAPKLTSGAPALPPAPVDGVFDDEDRGDDGE